MNKYFIAGFEKTAGSKLDAVKSYAKKNWKPLAGGAAAGAAVGGSVGHKKGKRTGRIQGAHMGIRAGVMTERSLQKAIASGKTTAKSRFIVDPHNVRGIIYRKKQR